ncbi:P27 family phage terminase small subunit [Bradyrhizobium sp. CB1717]|uniref:P27 family phage terminase small subunit n=1 Tax=Bradyrhizobium sp. CB1717 TaxID=3039154 RepID=UPI0024B111AA|nr:P27 family phage terminase small subunit [Bradyrhizobium sp. CB1717]WFU23164.1 P27 family phage terminase small subunit [Bradyrhizobium sp. CB1717]
MTKSTPKHLRKDSTEFFKHVMQEYSLDEHHVILLTKACEALDRVEEARAAIKTHGLTYTDRFGTPRARPEVAIERANRLAVARLFRELGLDLAGDGKTAPPALPGNR